MLNEEIQQIVQGDISEEHEVIQNLPDTGNEISDDEALKKDDIESLKDHNKKYTQLLDIYVTNLKTVYAQKKIGRVVVLAISLMLLIFVPLGTGVIVYLSFNYIKQSNNVDMTALIPTLLTSFAGMLTTLLTVPHLITEYLFNKEEEATMASVIGKIQDYDISVRKKQDKE